MTHARHLKATGTPADLRAGRVRDAHRKLYRAILESVSQRKPELHDRVQDCQRECLEVLEEAETET